jgi:hypothetical protein
MIDGPRLGTKSPASTGIRPTLFASMHIEISAIALLLAIGVLSYLLGHLCGQMQFHRKTARIASCRKKKLGEDRSEKTWAPRAILPASSAVPIYDGQVPAMRIAGFFVPTKPTRPESRDRHHDS